MRRILKLLARLYPSAWRARYGAEYEALIEDAEPRARDGFDVFWGVMAMRVTARSFVRIVLPCALLGALAAVGISFSRPALYRSRTLILVDTADRRPIDTQLQGLVRESQAQPILASIIQQENLYPDERSRMPLGDVVDLMRKNIWIRPLQKSGGQAAPALALEFAYPDPHVAQKVDRELVSGLIGLNLREAIASPSAPLRPHTTFTVRFAADLPKQPMGLTHLQMILVGLLSGFCGGIALATVLAAARRDVIEGW